MIRGRVLIGGIAMATLGLAAVPGHGVEAVSGGGCVLQGTANFHNPLGQNAGPFAYDFSGALSNCQATPAGPASGTVTAGQVLTIAGVKYQEPIPQGSGSCANGTTGGTAIVQWSDGGTTVENYTTTSVAAAVALQGSVVPSVTLQPVAGQTGATPITLTTNRFNGDSAAGALIFGADPTKCAANNLTSASITGSIGQGSQN